MFWTDRVLYRAVPVGHCILSTSRWPHCTTSLPHDSISDSCIYCQVLLCSSLRLRLSYSKLLVFFVQLSSLSFLLLFLFNPFYPCPPVSILFKRERINRAVLQKKKKQYRIPSFRDSCLSLQALPFACLKYSTLLSIIERRSRVESTIELRILLRNWNITFHL
jgi:hypothetical protein